MPQIDVNWVAVAGAAVLSMVIGFLWYGPLFGSQWMKLMGVSAGKLKEANKKMQVLYGKSFITMLVLSYVLAVFVRISADNTPFAGALTGFWLWLGFLATTGYMTTLFGGKSVNLFFIDTGYQLAYMLAMGAILAVWR